MLAVSPSFDFVSINIRPQTCNDLSDAAVLLYESFSSAMKQYHHIIIVAFDQVLQSPFSLHVIGIDIFQFPPFISVPANAAVITFIYDTHLLAWIISTVPFHSVRALDPSCSSARLNISAYLLCSSLILFRSQLHQRAKHDQYDRQISFYEGDDNNELITTLSVGWRKDVIGFCWVRHHDNYGRWIGSWLSKEHG